MIACYLDDSSDLRRERVLTAAGFLQRNSYWLDFERVWKARLREFGITYFKASECISLSGEFAHFRQHQGQLTDNENAIADRLRSELIEVILNAKLEGVALSILLSDFNQLRSEDPRCAEVFGSDAMFVAYHGLMVETAKRSSTLFPNDRIAFVCDSHPRSLMAEKSYEKMVQKNPSTARFMGSIDHADDKEIVALQAADLLASEARLKTEAWLNSAPVFPGFQKLADSGAVNFVAYWDRAYMLDVLDKNSGARKP